MSQDAEQRAQELLAPLRGERLEHEVYVVLHRRVVALIAAAVAEAVKERDAEAEIARLKVERQTLLESESSLMQAVQEGDEELARLREKADAEMLRVKACEHIADGDEGWEVLRNECPSTAAVARLRDRLAEERERCAKYGCRDES